MKAFVIPAIAAASLLSACATATAPADYRPTATEFTGYIVFNEEEFQLYPREAQIRTPFSRPCLSGALPLNQQRAARQDLPGQKVTISGRTAAWAGRTITHEGVDIRNTCGGPFVLLGDDVTVLR